MALTFLALVLAAQASESAITPGPLKQKICRESAQETGSHIRTGRRCKTAEEWRRLDEERGRFAPSARVTESQGDSMTNQRPPH